MFANCELTESLPNLYVLQVTSSLAELFNSEPQQDEGGR